MPVIVVGDDSRFAAELAAAGSNLAVVDFTASWCGPCQRIAPVFAQLAERYSRGAVFLKVDVDQCPESAASNGVSAMPTFMFFRNRTRLAKIQGADPASLEAKIQELVGSVDTASEGSSGGAEAGVAGHIDLSSMIQKNETECLNESDDHPLQGALTGGSSTFLESDCDEQLIINLAFSQNVKLHSIKFDAPTENGPKNVRLFINQPRTLDFDQAGSMEAVQELELIPKDLASKAALNLRYVKFQNVSNLIIFVKDNQNGSDVTRINHVQLIGSPVATTNMSDFKRIAGKKGEGH
jgi:thioredoxin